MPFIHIKSLPLEESIDITEILMSISKEFSKEMEIPLVHIHTTWEFYQPGHYVKGDTASEYHPKCHYPIIIDLLTPDFNDLGTIKSMLENIASTLSNKINFPINNIFINHRQAHSKMVFDDGKVVEWQ